MEGVQTLTKTQTAWPSHQPASLHTVMFRKPDLVSASSNYLLEWKVTPDELCDFFHSGLQTLCPWYSHFQLPDIVQAALTKQVGQEGHSASFSSFDRLIIYTDGSSKAHNRRKAPLWVQEFDAADAWSFVVLGEKYGTSNTPPIIEFLGWHAQPVLYETHLPHYVGSNEIGSEHAEREALLWAGIWRLGINSTIPTIFRTDSSTTGDQASGRVSCPSQHPAFITLRSTFQALTAGLGPDELRVEHVAGHAGDPWNEFADFLAKNESAIGHKLCRQQVDMQKWRPLLPFFWMLFDQKAGLPQFTANGFDIQPPDAPSLDSIPVATTKHTAKNPAARADYFLSVASLNVGSLFVGPDGHAGKLQYVREQMKSLHLNFLGLQETRSPACLSLADDVIRLSGGDLHLVLSSGSTLYNQFVIPTADPDSSEDPMYKLCMRTQEDCLSELSVLNCNSLSLFCMHHRAVDPLLSASNGGCTPMSLLMHSRLTFQFLHYWMLMPKVDQDAHLWSLIMMMRFQPARLSFWTSCNNTNCACHARAPSMMAPLRRGFHLMD